MKKDKVSRILYIYNRLMNGKVIYKAEEAQRFGVDRIDMWLRS